MSLATIRTAVKTALESVTSIGVVTDFEPYVTRKEDFERYFKSDSTVKGWTISRDTTAERQAGGNSVERTHQIVIRGYMALGAGTDAATEKTFQDLIESVCTRLRQEIHNKFSAAVLGVGAPQVRIVEARLFSGYLVHYGEITLPVAEALVVA